MLLPKVAVRETFPQRTHGISETLSKDSGCSQNTGTSTARPSANSVSIRSRTAKAYRSLEQHRVGVEDVRRALQSQRHAADDLLIEPQQPDREGAGPEIFEALIGCDDGGNARRVVIGWRLSID